MATAYVGPRPILAGRNTNNWVHFWKNKVGVYSNYSLQGTSPKVLSGAPDNERTLGTDGKVRKPGYLELIYTGKQPLSPMDNPGSGTRLAGARFRPLEYKGSNGVSAFPSGYGHSTASRFYFEGYNNWVFDGVPGSEAIPSSTVGHPHRTTMTYGAAFDPYSFRGTAGSLAMPGTIGQANTSSVYGRQKVNEWKGSPSQKAL